MNRIIKICLSFFILVSMSACGCMRDVEEDVKNEVDKVEDNLNKDENNNSTQQNGTQEGKMSDLMMFLKDKGVKYENEKTLDSFEFAAKEGVSFTVEGQPIYAYRVDPSDDAMRKLLDNVTKNNTITASLNGVETEYGARVNGNYLMIYERQAQVQELLDQFAAYKANKDSAN